jgi:hypothetical protein
MSRGFPSNNTTPPFVMSVGRFVGLSGVCRALLECRMSGVVELCRSFVGLSILTDRLCPSPWYYARPLVGMSECRNHCRNRECRNHCRIVGTLSDWVGVGMYFVKHRRHTSVHINNISPQRCYYEISKGRDRPLITRRHYPVGGGEGIGPIPRATDGRARDLGGRKTEDGRRETTDHIRNHNHQPPCRLMCAQEARSVCAASYLHVPWGVL